MNRDERHPWDDDEPTTPYEWLRTARVLVAEDDDSLRRMIATRLRADGCQVIEAASGDEALDVVSANEDGSSGIHALDLVVIDVRMPGVSGLDVVRLMRAWQWPTPVLVVTAYPSPEVFEQAIALDANVLPKPFVLSRLSRVAGDTLAGKVH